MLYLLTTYRFAVHDTDAVITPTTIIPEINSLVRFGTKIYRVDKKAYNYSYIEDADTTDITVDIFLEEDNSLIYVERDKEDFGLDEKPKPKRKRTKKNH